jgi:peptide-methionine (S)-S-oxide reductase
MKKATFAAGCFWGVESGFRKVKGVKDAISGYTGGHLENPSYEDVCYKKTGHAEAVEVSYDPEQVTYKELLKKFWEMHDPTTMNRQGPDVGSQYRSAIFYHDEEQKKQAKESLKEEQKKHENKIVTEITEAGKFWKAEEYHQRYFEKTGKRVCH